MVADIETSIRKFLATTFMLHDSVDEIPSDVSLRDSGVIDSLGVFDLIGFVESEYGVEVTDEDVVPENFDSVKKLAMYIANRAVHVFACFMSVFVPAAAL